ncbi:MAG: BTAD domain-containing putative transcriptional regulator [Solirubrobacterales bacterium]
MLDPTAGRAVPSARSLRRAGPEPEPGRDAGDPIPAALAEALEATGAEAAELFLAGRFTDRVWMAAHRGLASRAFRERVEFDRGEGLPGLVIERGEPIVLRKLAADRRYLRDRVRERGFRSYLCAPVHGGGRVLGSIHIASRRDDAPAADRLAALSEIADRLGERLEMARLRARERLAEAMLSEPELDPKRNLERKIERGLDAMIEIAEADGGIVLLRGAATGSLHPWAWRGTYERARSPLARSEDPCDCAVIAESLDSAGPAEAAPDCGPACTLLPAELASTVCLPLLAGDRVLGAVSVGWRSREALPGRHLPELEGTVAQLALAVADEQAAVIAEERASETQRRRLLDGIDLAAEHSLQPVMLRIERAGTLAETPPRLRTELGSIQGLLRDSGRKIVESARSGSQRSAESAPAGRPCTAPLLDLRCFGRFEVFRGGQPIPPERFARRRALTLLKILLTNYGKPVHREVLAGLLWEEEPPKDPARQLKVVAHYLRRALEPERRGGEGSQWVLSTGEGYAFDVSAPHRLDHQDFLSLAHWAERLRERGEPEAALAAYEAAAGLYTGDFLEDERYSDWCGAEREHLRETLLSTLWRAADLRLERGDAEGALACHRRALLADPAREDVHREVMRVLWREGRHGDALRQYRLCAEALRRELGAEPSPETRALYESLAAPRPA